MSKTFIIAEAACTWLHAGLEGAFRSIKAAKECGADAWKTQWTSDPEAMAMRRGVARDKYTRLGWAGECLPKLKHMCDEVGIEFMCTVFIEKDIDTIAKYVKRFKVSAFESGDSGFVAKCANLGLTIASVRENSICWMSESWEFNVRYIHVVSKYPCPLEDLKLSEVMAGRYGLSDHTTSTLTGALCVAAGGRIVEKHFRLDDTPESDPDFSHSLPPDKMSIYISNIREAERAM